jgi:hypothetical protein
MGFPMVHVGPHWSIGFRRFLAETHNEVVSAACTEFAVLLAMQRGLSQALLLAMQRGLSQALLLAMQRGLSSGATASAQSANRLHRPP